MPEPISVMTVSHRPLLAEAWTALLTRQPALVVHPSCADLDTALKLHQTDPRCILLVDSKLPELKQHLGALRDRGQVPPMLVIVEYENPEEAAGFLQQGVRGIVSLAQNKQQLIECLREVARGELALPQSLAQSLLARLTGRENSRQNQSESTAETFTEREHEVLVLLCQGLSNKAIAQQLYLSVRTVEGHLVNIYNKLGTHNRTQAVLRAIEQGLIETEH